MQQAEIIVGALFTPVLYGFAVSLYRSLRAEVPAPEPRPVVTIPEAGVARPRPGEAAGS